jgi:hypothetical protein
LLLVALSAIDARTSLDRLDIARRIGAVLKSAKRLMR